MLLKNKRLNDSFFNPFFPNLEDVNQKIYIVKATEEMYSQKGFPEEEKQIQKAVAKRQREFRASRHAARAAIKKLNLFTDEQVNMPILSGSAREPLFPNAITGSISHTDNICLAACALKSNVASLGIDIENNARLATHLFPTVYTHNEQQLLTCTNNVPDTLIFSIKESLFKCCFPFVQVYFDFLDAQITLDPTAECSGKFRFELIGHNQAVLSEKLPNLPFHGYYCFDQQYVFSLCYFA